MWTKQLANCFEQCKVGAVKTVSAPGNFKFITVPPSGVVLCVACFGVSFFTAFVSHAGWVLVRLR